MRYGLIWVLMLVLLCGSVIAAERDYQGPWCAAKGGETEHVLPDRTRIDCLTDTHAIEFDWGSKWAEAIGQALYYSAETGARAGIVLILKAPDEQRFVDRTRRTIEAFDLPIDLWVIE